MPTLPFKPPLLCDFPCIIRFASYQSQLKMKGYCRNAVAVLWWRMVRWLPQQNDRAKELKNHTQKPVPKVEFNKRHFSAREAIIN